MSTPVAGIAASIAAAASHQSTTASTPEAGLSPNQGRPSAQTSLPATMNAAARHRYGARVRTETADRPEPGPDQVLVQVAAAGIDRGTSHVHTGTPYLMRLAGFGVTKPVQPILGMDVSGTVVALGSNVTDFELGDAVFGIATGAFAEYAIADAAKLSQKPEELSHTQAAAVPISAGTAWQALVDVGRLQAGQRVLILGASGGVGSYAVQIAKALGADVTGVASRAKLDYVRSLGANTVIDYRSADPVDGSSTYDLIIDIGGRRPLRHLRRALHRTGTLVITGGEGGNRITGGIGRQLRATIWSAALPQQLTFFIAKEGRESIDALSSLLTSGAVTPSVNRRYRLGDVQTALDDLEAGRLSGKAVVELR